MERQISMGWYIIGLGNLVGFCVAIKYVPACANVINSQPRLSNQAWEIRTIIQTGKHTDVQFIAISNIGSYALELTWY